MLTSDFAATLGDYFTLQRGNTYKSQLLGKAGPVLLGLATIQRNGGFRGDSLQSYGGESPEKLLVYPGELYLSLKDVTQSADLLGAVARLPSYISVGRLTQDTVKLQPKHSDTPVKFLYWLLRTPQYRSYCRSYATGTTNLGLSREDFLSFPVPRLTTALNQLVDLLDALDDKIELNRRMNETLEAMARAIFKSWFVDFDPVRAKAEGRTPAGMDAETAALFPDSFVDSALGEIPAGWSAGRLDDLLVLQRGFDLPSHERIEGSYPVIAASGVNGYHSQFQVQAPGVTTGRSGVLGKVFYVQENFWPLNTSLYVKNFKVASPLYAYFILQTLDFAIFNAGSAVPTLNRNHVHGLPALLPSQEVIAAFDRLTIPMFKKIHRNIEESETLSSLCDTLLPKLLSGELRVKAAEHIVAETP
jgi:type I restriction enzyme S subunit